MYFKMVLRQDTQFPIKVILTLLLLTFSADGKPTSSPSVAPDQVTVEEIVNDKELIVSPSSSSDASPEGNPPKIVDSKQTADPVTGLIILTCYYTSNSRATVSWLKNGEPWSPPNQSQDLTTNPQTIRATNIPETYNEMIYTCVVNNKGGKAFTSFSVKRGSFFANFFRSFSLLGMVRP